LRAAVSSVVSEATKCLAMPERIVTIVSSSRFQRRPFQPPLSVS
jgi:hypothetical protein